MARLSLIDDAGEKRVRMANLATVGSHAVNGVAGNSFPLTAAIPATSLDSAAWKSCISSATSSALNP